MRIIRLFEILDDLRAARRPVTAQVFAQRYHVSLRTIYRDMAMLQSIGAPIIGEGGLGYQIESGFFLPPLHFNEDEMDGIILGLRLLASRSDNALAQASLTAMGKIADVLPEGAKESFLNRPLMAVSKKATEDELNDANFILIRQSIRSHQKLTIKYLSLAEDVSERIIHPLGLTTFDNVWLLTAWCELKDDYRNFRVDRILSITARDEKFETGPGKSFQNFIQGL